MRRKIKGACASVSLHPTRAPSLISPKLIREKIGCQKKDLSARRFHRLWFDVTVEPAFTRGSYPNPTGETTMRFMVMVKATKGRVPN
jgi:hypothetical protein